MKKACVPHQTKFIGHLVFSIPFAYVYRYPESQNRNTSNSRFCLAGGNEGWGYLSFVLKDYQGEMRTRN